MAKKKYVPVRLDGEIFESLKKVAVAQGKSVSETVGMLVSKSLESGPVSNTGKDLTTALKEALWQFRAGERENDKNVRELMSDMGLESARGLSVSESGHGFSPEVVRYMVEAQAKLESILLSMVEDLSGGAGKLRDWTKKADTKSDEVLRNLRIERKV